MTKLAIFDLDGTLLDTVKDLGNATNHALTECGFPTHPIKAYYQMVGRGIYNLFRAAVPAGQSTEEVVQRMASIFIPYYDAHKCDFTRPYDGIPGMLKTITAAGVRLAVASNKYQDGAEKLVHHFFGEYDFVRILGQREGQPITGHSGSGSRRGTVRHQVRDRLCGRLQCGHADRPERRGQDCGCELGFQNP